MQIFDLGLRDLKLISPRRHQDSRGWFAETFNRKFFLDAGLPVDFSQDNQSFSRHGVLRGLHYQVRQPQGKLIRVLNGHIWDVAVDLRRSSPDFGRWTAVELRAPSAEEELEMLWIPEGFAHGFLVLSEVAEVSYKVTRPYDPGGEHTIFWNDPQLQIAWPLDRLNGTGPIVSDKDASGLAFSEAEHF
jgi:dTDP-4-dehydrorhamnose 3,5-epimerase